MNDCDYGFSQIYLWNYYFIYKVWIEILQTKTVFQL